MTHEGLNITDFDAVGLGQLVAAGDVHPHELLDAHLARLELVDPHVGAIWSRFEARARGQIDRGLPVGPLSGVPFVLKDLAVHLEGEVITCGSRYFADHRSSYTSHLVQRYLDAGLVIFAKAATAEFGLGPTANGDLYPVTVNPWDPSRIAGGSSTGSAAAVAARLVPAAHASDGGGSIRIPAAACGVFGFKPSRGRISAAPTAEPWGGMATSHVITRSVRDSAVLLDLTAGSLPGEPYQCPAPGGTFLEASMRDPQPLHIAAHVEPATGGLPEAAIQEAFERTCVLLESLGHHVELVRPTWDLAEVSRLYGILTAASVRLMIEDRSRILGRDPGPQDLLPVTATIARRGSAHTSVDLARTREVCFAAAREIAAFTESYDVVLCPTLAQLPPEHDVYSQREGDADDYLSRIFAFAPYTAPASLAGQPAMSVPLEWSPEGLPIGMHVSSAFGQEERLFSLAGQLERSQPWESRRPDLIRSGP